MIRMKGNLTSGELKTGESATSTSSELVVCAEAGFLAKRPSMSRNLPFLSRTGDAIELPVPRVKLSSITTLDSKLVNPWWMSLSVAR